VIIDTCLTVGVSPLVEFVAEERLGDWLDAGRIDLQFIYQPDESFQHETSSWNPFLGNDYIASVQRDFPDRVRGLATVQPWHQAHRAAGSRVERSPALEELERAIVDLGLHGLRINPIQHNVQFNNATVMWPVLERLADLQRRVERRLVVSVHAYGDSLNNSPEALADTASRFPDLLFLMQHSAFVWGYGSVSRIAAPVDNLLLDLSTMPQRAVVWEAYQRHGARRFCIGSDGPHGTLALKRAIVDDFARDEREAALILGENLAERLALPTIQPTTVHGASA
jgi:predicted TIM-barrel fold metal-dependent hydrolase